MRLMGGRDKKTHSSPSSPGIRKSVMNVMVKSVASRQEPGLNNKQGTNFRMDIEETVGFFSICFFFF